MRFSFLMAGLYLASQMALTASPLNAPTQNASTNKSADNSKMSAQTSNSEQQLTQLSTRMLRQIDLARQAIASKETQTAVQHVNEAIADQSQVATLAKSKGLPTVVPLYSEFDESSVLGPLQAKRKN